MPCARHGRAAATGMPVFCYIYIGRLQGTDRKNSLTANLGGSAPAGGPIAEKLAI